jgi:hypothetical protein
MEKSSPLSMTSGAEEALREYLDSVKEKIADDASKSAQSEHREVIWPKDITEASTRFEGRIDKEKSRIGRFGSAISSLFSSIPPIAIVSAILAVVFGYLGSRPGGGQSALDIAKIFAGAVVGSSGAAAHSAIKRRRVSTLASHSSRTRSIRRVSNRGSVKYIIPLICVASRVFQRSLEYRNHSCTRR